MDTQQTQQIIDIVQNGINSLSAQLGVSLPQLWEVVIRQQYVEVVQSVLIFIFCIIGLYCFYKYFKYRAKDNDYEVECDIVAIIVTLVLAIITLVSTIDLIESSGKLINPEYYAIQDITNFVKN
jgi:heme/copper-type cytochrome/quinol oxidase subunit 2